MVGDLPRGVLLNSKGKPVLPDERFSSANELRQVCQNMLDADNRRARLRERVEGLFNQFPTFPRSVTAAKGMGWYPRVNYGELSGLIQSTATPLFDLVTEVEHCIEIDLDVPNHSDEQVQEWEQKIAKHFTWLLFKRWRDGFNYMILLHQREMLLHGLGAQVWPNNRWWGRTPRSGHLLFPEAAPLNFKQDGKYCMIRDFVPGEDVYSFIRNEEAAKKEGWFPENVWATLAKAQKKTNIQGRSSSSTDLDPFQRRFRRGDIGFAVTSEVGLWLNWMMCAEFEHGISLYCIEENIECGKKDGGYLFKKRFKYDEFPLTLFPFDIGNGEIQSIYGLGVRSKDFYELSNRINNAMAVQVLISALPQVRQTRENVDPDKLKLMRMGALAIWPYGVEAAVQQFPPLANSGLALQKHLRDTLEGNNQAAIRGAPEPKDRETKYSFMLRASDAASVSNGLQSLYEGQLQQLYDHLYRMVVNTPPGNLPYQKMAEEFRQRCLKDGVPKEALKENAIGEIHEKTSTGAGSASNRLQALMILFNTPVYQNASEDKKIAIERAIVAASLGQVAVERFARSVRDTDLPDQDTSLAMQESNGLAMGGDAIVSTRQDDVKHITNHLQKAGQIIEQVQQGQIDPQHALVALQKLLNHAGEELSRLRNNQSKQNEFKQLADQWRQIAKVASQLQREVESQQEEPNPEQQISEDAQVEMRHDDMEHQRKMRKDEMDMERKFRKDAMMGRLADYKTAAEIDRNGARDRARVA